ncbi:MAG: hypothetical protein HC884_00895 [Chloroflexaceae bacterium]|nr:hypothetical protein [Chloroflexaceae bacterium]
MRQKLLGRINELIVKLKRAGRPIPAHAPLETLTQEDLIDYGKRLRVHLLAATGELRGGEDDDGRFWWCEENEKALAGPFEDEWAAQVWAQPELARPAAPAPAPREAIYSQDGGWVLVPVCEQSWQVRYGKVIKDACGSLEEDTSHNTTPCTI